MNRLWTAGVALIAGAACLFAQKQPQVKSQKEADAVQALFGAQDVESRIKLANELITKFADTDFKAYAFLFLAEAYDVKGDFEKTVFYGEETLKADPKNFAAMLILAGGYAKRTKEFDFDKEEKLANADKYAKAAMEALKVAQKPNPAVPDEQWEQAKKVYVGQAHEALGLSAQVRKKYDVAIAEFKLALENAQGPDQAIQMVRLGQAYNLAGKPDEAIPLLDKVMTMPDVQPQVKQYAQAQRVAALQAKNKAAGPAKPAPAPNAPANPPAEQKKP